MDAEPLSFDKDAIMRGLAKMTGEGVPTRFNLVETVRNQFEGPINLDLMALGMVKNIVQGA